MREAVRLQDVLEMVPQLDALRRRWTRPRLPLPSAGVLGGDDNEFHVAYFCYRCMAVRWGCDKGDALIRIRDGRGDIKRRREKNLAFNAAAATVVAAVPGVSRGQRWALVIDLGKEAMGPIARFVRIKT